MPNWCSTAYVIDGDAKEVKQLYELMKGLEERKTPSVENGFGTTWLGCLVDALGKDWNDVRCRGSWNGLEMDGDVLKFSTETAWAPCSETFDLVREAFPNLRYYFQAEEPGMEVYETNDEFGTYFSDRFFLDACSPEEEYLSEYFETQEDAFAWLEEKCGEPIKSAEDVKALDERWQRKTDAAFSYLHEFQIVNQFNPTSANDSRALFVRESFLYFYRPPVLQNCAGAAYPLYSARLFLL